MTWLGKSKEEIRGEIMAIAKEETGINSFRDGGVMRGLIETFTQAVYPLYEDVMKFYGGQFTYLQAEGDMLSLRGLELGVERHGAVKASGNLHVKADMGTAIAEGVWAVSPAGLRFRVVDRAVIEGGDGDDTINAGVLVEAEFPGDKYNLAPGTSLRFTTVVAGIKSLTAPDDWLTIGRDEETDADYRERIGARWDAVGDDNRPGKYELAALNVPQINDVKVIRTPRGPGSVDIVVGTVDGIPTEETLQEVENILSSEKLMTRDLIVRAAMAIDVDFEFTYGDTSIEGEVAEEKLRQWVMQRRVGESLSMQDLYREVFPDGLAGLEYQSPQSTVDVTDYQKVRAASVTATVS